jgi:hypothetical protein
MVKNTRLFERFQQKYMEPGDRLASYQMCALHMLTFIPNFKILVQIYQTEFFRKQISSS